jgi:predicted nucleotide-binding protein (sugar kinase/HSP70/actin superfamily)
MVEKIGAEPSRMSGRLLYIPRMTYGGARAFAASFRSIGIDATIVPPSDRRTLELGLKHSSGDECYPEQVTLGDFLKIIESPGYRAEKTAFFMPTADGPCRFGQYAPYMRMVLEELGEADAMIISPTSANGYAGVGEHASELIRTAWRALVASDALRKLLLKTRPYELNAGETDRVYEECLTELCAAVEPVGLPHKEKLEQIGASLLRSRDRFRRIPIAFDPSRPLIGVVGEIFCRLNTFSNENIVRRIERHGGEVWLSDVSEWVWYTDYESQRKLRMAGRRWSKAMLGGKIKAFFQRRDEHKLVHPLHEDFRGYEEQDDVRVLFRLSQPYLPHTGALGEMVLNMGKAAYLYEKGADGIIDISPFSCMNGITCEAIYPKLSRDKDGIPVRIFYFDGTQSDLDRDIGIFLEMARAYQQRKRKQRVHPLPRH